MSVFRRAAIFHGELSCLFGRPRIRHPETQPPPIGLLFEERHNLPQLATIAPGTDHEVVVVCSRRGRQLEHIARVGGGSFEEMHRGRVTLGFQ